ncbi:MAG TPA: methyl-accepting chemotaxis protein [Stenotrophobium sp.]|jgi:methyl-accepting chemotaxis protein|nr:methyl-accepting chemotaxis protein [Stenotrophobium sp.]
MSKKTVSVKKSAARSAKPAVRSAVVAALPGRASIAEKVLAMAEYAPDGRLLAANERLLSMLGYALDEVREQPHEKFLEPTFAASDGHRALWAKLATGEAAQSRYCLLARDGSEVWVQSSFSPLLDRAGKIVRIVEVAADITGFSHEYEAVKAELDVRTAVMNTTSIVSMADKKGDILSINDKYVEISKFSREELIGSPHSITRHADMPKETFKKLWGTIGRGGIFRGMIKNRAKDGSIYYVDAVIAPFIGKNGKPQKYMGARYDITEAEVARQNMQGIVDALNKSQASIEFNLDGTIITANDNFLKAVGYSLDEIKGQHHGIFVESGYRSSPEYRLFWEKLRRGEYESGEFKRIGKGGKEIWIQASYNPICDEMGRPVKVIKYCTDITAAKLRASDFEGQLAAIGKAQAVIEFTLDGKIVHANENFLNALGYTLDEVKGQHHGMFVEPAYRASTEYRMFWEKLGRGEYESGQFKRIGKGGKEVWIQASYNPILDMNGKPFKVVKYASDVTAQVRASQALQKAVEESQAVVMAAKNGDLTERIQTEGKDGSIKDLCEGINTIVESMEGLVGRIKVSSDTINTAAREIAAGNTDLSQRTEEQASSLEETASSMEELTSTVKQNAENAKQANQLAIGASDIAVKGGKVVGEVVTTMSAINESSRKISDIIGVIDGIAFQTNILALNAAVEAARAGEQGRGFAVVAAEVRSLAQRSAGAAKEIKTLIGDSVGKVDTGTKLVAQAGQTMEEIVNSVKRVTDIMGEITAASQEQSAGIEQVNQAITQMDEVTQQNAALVEEASASARSMEEQAGGLVAAVAQYRIGSDSEEPVRPQAAATPVARVPVKPVVRSAAIVRGAKKPLVATPARVNGANGHKPASEKSEEQWSEF